MIRNILFFGLMIGLTSCKTTTKTSVIEKSSTLEEKNTADFTIAFGSCNKTDIANRLWDDIYNVEPSIWIWGGDNIYADTDDMVELRQLYANQKKIQQNTNLFNGDIPIIGTWDDHDYGLNDGGVEFKAKKGSQQEFLNFMDVPEDSPRRKQDGVYVAHHYATPNGTVSVFVLDTRYFRTAITIDTVTNKRLKPNAYGDGTVLGETQWQWLANELNTSSSDFNIIISSIQLLSNEHGFECWGNFPHERDRFKKTLVASKAKGVIVLSGDRHISEFSKAEVEGLNYPLIDFTSSGLTHAYQGFKGETNPFRVGDVVFTESFGILEFDFEQRKVFFKMLGDGGKVLGELVQQY